MSNYIKIHIPLRISSHLEYFLFENHIKRDDFFNNFYIKYEVVDQEHHHYDYIIYNYMVEHGNKLLSHVSFTDVWNVYKNWFSFHIFANTSEDFTDEMEENKVDIKIDTHFHEILSRHDGLLHIEYVESKFPFNSIGLSNFIFNKIVNESEEYENYMGYLQMSPFGQTEQRLEDKVLAGFYDKWGFKTDKFLQQYVRDKERNRYLIRDID